MQGYKILQTLATFQLKNNLSVPTMASNDDYIQQQDQFESFRNENGQNASKFGRWNYDQQILYLEFVKNNPIHLENKDRRRSTKVFKQMAKVVTTRSADQCRSHHQKMQKKHDTIQNILAHCKKTLHKLKAKKNQEKKQKLLLVPLPTIVKEISQTFIQQTKTPITQKVENIEYDNISEFFKEDEPLDIQFKLEQEQSCFLDFFNENYQMPF